VPSGVCTVVTQPAASPCLHAPSTQLRALRRKETKIETYKRKLQERAQARRCAIGSLLRRQQHGLGALRGWWIGSVAGLSGGIRAV
jgi:hypothetical protein